MARYHLNKFAVHAGQSATLAAWALALDVQERGITALEAVVCVRESVCIGQVNRISAPHADAAHVLAHLFSTSDKMQWWEHGLQDVPCSGVSAHSTRAHFCLAACIEEDGHAGSSGMNTTLRAQEGSECTKGNSFLTAGGNTLLARANSRMQQDLLSV